jgi:cytoskeletal protein CcmA (bactofilin family)
VNPYLGVAVLCLLSGALFILPLVPALVELRRKSDALPLTVVQQHTGEIRFFADGFRTYLKALEPTLQQCVRSGETATGAMPDGSEYVVFGRGEQALLLPLQEREEGCQVMIAAGTELLLPAETTFSKDIYAAEGLIGGTKNRYRAILAEKDVHLGNGSVVLRWVHAVGRFSTDPDCKLYGRISSDRIIRLNSDCTFLRLNAPQIETGETTGLIAPSESADSPAAAATPVARTLCDGDLEIPPGEVLHGSLVVRGRLHIGSGARICGSVKSEKSMVLQPRVSVEGSLISARSMYIGRDCRIRGPVIAERTIQMEGGTRCGTAESPTTVSAPRIEVEPGVVVMGTLWARDQGRVVASL